MIIDPAEENLFGGQLEEIRYLLSRLEQAVELRMASKVHSREQANLSNILNLLREEYFGANIPL